MSGQGAAQPGSVSGLLGRDYWLILFTPEAGTSQADVDACAPEHIAWLLSLERDGVCSCPARCCPARERGPARG